MILQSDSLPVEESRTGEAIEDRRTPRHRLLLRRRLKNDQIYFYHAGLTKEEKADVEKWFFDSDVGILVATCAYGIGVDKAHIFSPTLCYTSSMDILCERFRETIDDKDAHCMAPDEFCKFRDTCMVFLIEEQRKKEKSGGMN